MPFYSYLFVFGFLPVFLGGYYLIYDLTEKKTGKPSGDALKNWILLASLAFCLYYNLYSLLVLLADCAVSYLLLQRLQTSDKKKGLLAAGILFHIAVLGYFKYFDFFAGSAAALFGQDYVQKNILLPLGISYITFQQIALLSDLYRGRTELPCFRDYLLYIFFFVKMMAGPVILYPEMRLQLQRVEAGKPSLEQAVRGGVRFVLGLAKASLMAAALGKIADYAFSGIASLTFLEALLGMILYMLQLYFDFSGYCDMGQGIAGMIGMELPENFNKPFHYHSFLGTWKNWHATLTAFLTRYLYIPLGGSRRGKGIMIRNMLIVFLVSGLWHGADFSFVVWGALNGVIYLAVKLLQGVRPASSSGAGQETDRRGTSSAERAAEGRTAFPHRAKDYILRFLNFLAFAFTFVLFRAENLADGFAFYGKLLTGLFKDNRFVLQRYYGECFEIQELWYALKMLRLTSFSGIHYICAALLTGTALYFALYAEDAKGRAAGWRFTLPGTLLLALLFVWSILAFSGVDTFIYLQF